MKHLTSSILVLLLFGAQAGHAATVKKAKPSHTRQASTNQDIDVTKDVDGLGGNQALYNMATSIDPDNRSRIVQQRIVDRHNRFELGLNYGYVAGGDSYLQTQSLGAAVDFHFSPRFSLGARYYDYTNHLTAEGSRQADQARADLNSGLVNNRFVLDNPLRSYMAVANWYPIYGKMNMLNMGIAQFDVYVLGGGGKIQLQTSGDSNIYTAGLGTALWMNKHVTARMEIRYQTYQDNPGMQGTRTLQETVGNLGMGIML